MSEGISRSPAWMFPLLLLGVTLAAYANCFSGVLVLDDVAFSENPALEDFGSFRWLQIRPRILPDFTFALDYLVWGRSLFGFHLTNLLIHLLNAWLVYLFVQTTWRLATRDGSGRATLSEDELALRAFAVALLWAVHPLQTQAVTYLVQRIEALASTGMLICLLGYARGATTVGRQAAGWYLVAFAGAMCAYASKEHSAVLFLLIVLYQRAYLSPTWSNTLRQSGWFVAALLLPLLCAAPIALRQLQSLGDQTTVGRLRGMTSLDYALSQPTAVLHYLRLIVRPDALCMDYGWDKICSPQNWFAFAGLMAVGIGIAWLWRQRPAAAFPLLAFFVILLPTSSFIPFQDIVFEHRVYLASAGVIATLSAALFHFVPGRGAVLVLIPLAICLAARTCLRNFDYYSRETLVASDLAVSPRNPRLYARSAELIPVEDRRGREFQLFERAVQLSEERGWFFAGTDYKWRRDAADILFKERRISEALKWYLACEPTAYDDTQLGEVRLSIALCHSMLGDRVAAEKYFQSAADKWDSPLVKQLWEAHRNGTATAAPKLGG